MTLDTTAMTIIIKLSKKGKYTVLISIQVGHASMCSIIISVDQRQH